MSALKMISVQAAKELLRQIGEHISGADYKRLEAILSLESQQERFVLAQAIQIAFPLKPLNSALKDFTAMKSRINKGAQEAEVAFSLESDSKKQTDPSGRLCWFEGVEDYSKIISEYSRQETSGVDPSNTVEQSGVVLSDNKDTRKQINYFISYAHKDKQTALQLIEFLAPKLNLSSEFKFIKWMDIELNAGDVIDDEIMEALDNCDFGFLLVSDNFLNSDYIKKHELGKFLPDHPDFANKRAISIGLKPVKFDGSQNLLGLEKHQIYRDADDKFFIERKTDTTKDRFASGLFDQIIRVARKRGTVKKKDEVTDCDRITRKQQELLKEDPSLNEFIHSEGVATSFKKNLTESDNSEKERSRIKISDHLIDWVSDPNSSRFYALLGEYGMGKTTACKWLTQELLTRRQADPSLPLPIYLDLRHVHIDKNSAQVPNLNLIIDMALNGGWRSGDATNQITSSMVIEQVTKQGALVIFDGLDEVLVHLDAAQGQNFTRQLWRILVQTEQDSPNGEQPAKGRMLISCRTHYFRTLRDQKTHFTSQDRDGLKAEDYQALLVLPFSREQIREYITKSLPQSDPDAVVELFRSIHNLMETAERPYTLKLLTEHIHTLERWRLEGRKVTGANLYEEMVSSWIERDNGKHKLIPYHKRLLMGHFAHSLWRSGRKSWSVQQLEDWLMAFLTKDAVIAQHYHTVDRELLKEDLRTATFLVREGEDQFRFAHTSLQEFFLADYLKAALELADASAWDIPDPNSETLVFLGQLLYSEVNQSEKLEPALETLNHIRSAYQPQISENALHYVLLAQIHGYPSISTAGFQLQGAQLSEFSFVGRKDQCLSLINCDFTGAKLNQAVFKYADVSQAKFDSSDLFGAEFLHCKAKDASYANAKLTATVFRLTQLIGTSFDKSRQYRTQFLRCDTDGTSGINEQLSLIAPNKQLISSKPANPITQFSGHNSCASAVAFSPDGTQLLSGSFDHTLRLWDAASGECLQAFKGHESLVASVAFSPDGSQLLSGSFDSTLRLWDAASGECLQVIIGHSNAVESIAFSPDGSQLLSGSYDDTLRLWDAASGECMKVLKGHEGRVASIAFSPDGSQLLSGSFDETLRLWDAANGECLQVVKGHEGWVKSVAFSPDGSQLLSGSRDYTLRLWDAANGECLQVLKEHKSEVSSVAFSPDGMRLLSGSHDRTLRLWDADSGECLQVLERPETWVTSVAFSPDGSQLLSGSDDHTLRLWDAANGECLQVLKGHKNWVASLAFSPDGSQLLSGSFDGTLRLWDAESGECLQVIKGGNNAVESVAFSPDGSQLLSGSIDSTLRLWDAASSECLQVLKGHDDEVASVAFSPNGSQLLSGSRDNTLRLWDAVSGVCLQVLNGHDDGIESVAFSPDGSQLLSGSRDKTLRLWDAVSGECLHVVKGLESWVMSIAFSPDGSQLLSGSMDRTLRLWDAASGECLQVLKGHESWVMSVAFSPDGTRVICGHDQGITQFLVQDSSPVGPQILQLAADHWASLSEDRTQVVYATSEAWRWLGYLLPDPDTGKPVRYPLETFGVIEAMETES